MSNTGDRRNGRVSRRLLPKLARLLGERKDASPEEAIERGVVIWRLISGPHFDAAATREFVAKATARSFHPVGSMHQTMAIAASPDRTPALHKLTVPTLVIHGLVDPLVLPSGGVATARAVPNSRLLMFPDMGHDLPEVRWDEIIDAIAANAERAA